MGLFRIPCPMPGDSDPKQRILELVRKADSYRKKTLNLQASENVLSDAVRNVLASDFASRYSHLEPSGHNSYGGTEFAEEILDVAVRLACEVYGSKFAEVRPIGGHVAVLASLLATCGKGDRILAVSGKYGGYPGYGNNYIPEMLSLEVDGIPYSDHSQEILYNELESVIKEKNTRAIVLGQSAFVRPYNLKRLRDIVDDVSPATTVIYDGSHVMGLIAGHQFQSDALKYCDILLGSTHKSFFGPQGGIILSNDEELFNSIREQLIWKTMDNYHLNRVAALALALTEMKEIGDKYAKLVATNSKNLAARLDDKGIGIRFAPWYSYSHQVILDTIRLESDGFTPLSFSSLLEKNGIIVDRDGRIGTSEISHMGITDMEEIADLILQATEGKNVKERAEAIVAEAPGV